MNLHFPSISPSLALFFPFFFVLLFILPAQGQTPIKNHFTSHDGLPSNTVFCVEQDRQGILWFGTDEGVCRYDGRTFEVFSTSNGLTDNQVLQIIEDSQGRLWMLTYNGLPCYYQDGQFYSGEALPLPPDYQTNNFLTSLTEDDKGTVYLGAMSGELATIHSNDSFTIEDVDTNAPFKGITGQWMQHNQLHSAAKNKVVFNHATQTCSPLPEESFDHPAFIRYFFDENRLYVGGSNQLTIYTETYEQLTQIDLPHEASVHFIGPGFYTSEVAIGTSNGLYYLNKGSLELTGPYLPGRTVTYTQRDHQGGWWITTFQDGVFFMQDPNILHFTKDEIPSVPVYSLAVHNDTLLFGSGDLSGGYLTKDTLKTWQLATVNHLRPYFRTTDIMSFGDGIHLKVEKRLVRCIRDQETYPYSFNCFDEHPSGKWVIGSSKGVWLWEPSIMQHPNWEPVDHFLPQDLDVLALQCENADSVLFGTINGVFRTTFSQGTTTAICEETRNKSITGIHVLPDGKVAVATAGWGLFIYQNDELLMHLNDTDHDFPMNIFRLRQDSTNRLWAMTSDGVRILQNPTDPYSRWHWSALNSSNGLLSSNTYDMCFYQGRYYIATAAGITQLPEKFIQASQSAPLLHLRSLSHQDTLLSLTDKTTLEVPTHPFWTLEWNAISFTAKTFEFRYRINDAPWILTPNNTLSFSSLPPGTYRIAVAAKGEFSDWSPAQTITLHITSRWWVAQLWPWAAALGLLGLLFWLHRTKIVVVNKRRLQTRFYRWIKRLGGNPLLEVSIGAENYRIPIREILYIQSDSNYCHVRTTTQKYLLLIPLKRLEELLAKDANILRVHRSYLINLRHVSIARNTEVVINSTTIPVGITYRQAYHRFYHQFKAEHQHQKNRTRPGADAVLG